MNHPEMIAVIQAHAAGKPLEARRHCTSNWVDLHGLTPLFNFQDWDFRVRVEPPKPREWWIAPNGENGYGGPDVISERNRSGLIRVREVL